MAEVELDSRWGWSGKARGSKEKRGWNLEGFHWSLLFTSIDLMLASIHVASKYDVDTQTSITSCLYLF